VSAFAALRADPAFARLRALSAALGADPAQVQGADDPCCPWDVGVTGCSAWPGAGAGVGV